MTAADELARMGARLTCDSENLVRIRIPSCPVAVLRLFTDPGTTLARAYASLLGGELPAPAKPEPAVRWAPKMPPVVPRSDVLRGEVPEEQPPAAFGSAHGFRSPPSLRTEGWAGGAPASVPVEETVWRPGPRPATAAAADVQARRPAPAPAGFSSFPLGGDAAVDGQASGADAAFPRSPETQRAAGEVPQPEAPLAPAQHSPAVDRAPGVRSAVRPPRPTRAYPSEASPLQARSEDGRPQTFERSRSRRLASGAVELAAALASAQPSRVGSPEWHALAELATEQADAVADLAADQPDALAELAAVATSRSAPEPDRPHPPATVDGSATPPAAVALTPNSRRDAPEPGSDLRELMEQIATELEFEFVQIYGTGELGR
jgi:hypothetical protein